MGGTKRRYLGNPEERKNLLTSDQLANFVLDHVLDNRELFLATEAPTNSAEHFLRVMDSLTALATEVARKALVNRTSLSALPSFAGEICADPDAGDMDGSFELRYRLVEQYGDNPPHKDDVFTLDEASDIYGLDFVKRYWGELGENCPSCVTTGQNRQLWFSVVRYPAQNMSLSDDIAAGADVDAEDVLAQITSSPAFGK